MGILISIFLMGAISLSVDTHHITNFDITGVYTENINKGAGVIINELEKHETKSPINSPLVANNPSNDSVNLNKNTESYRWLIVSCVSALSLILSFVSFVISQRKSNREMKLVKTKAVIELHERWWGKELWELRTDVGLLVVEWKKTGVIPEHCYNPRTQSSNDIKLNNVQKIGRIGNFFADLNLMIDEDLVCVETVARLFGKSQLFWFLPFFQALEQVRKETRSEPLPRWFEEVYELSNKLKKVEIEKAQHCHQQI